MRLVKDYEIFFVVLFKYLVNVMICYGRVICFGSIGYLLGKNYKVIFVFVDVDILYIKFIEVDYDDEKKFIEEKIKKEGFLEEFIKIFYYGKV